MSARKIARRAKARTLWWARWPANILLAPELRISAAPVVV